MFKGSIVALVTPFRHGKVDEEGLSTLIDFHLENGTHGIVACGTTGESATLSHEEHDAVVDYVIQRVAGRVPVIAGSGSNATHEAIRRTTYAKKAGADAALLVAPYYNKPTQEGLYQHFKAVAESADIPVILYNVPGRTVVSIAPETVARLAEVPNIIGIKEASGSLQLVSDVIGSCPEDFIVLSGDDFVTYPMLAVGAVGVISVTANVAPADVAEMCDAHLSGDAERARALHYKLRPLNRAMFIETNPIPAKTTLALMGKISGEFRLPLCPPSEASLARIRKTAEGYGLIGAKAKVPA